MVIYKGKTMSISVMVSGGIDSLVAYRLAKARYGNETPVTPVFVNVNQP
jgi:tRNA(Ile)-lysidine synthase TilS/MesJ